MRFTLNCLFSFPFFFFFVKYKIFSLSESLKYSSLFIQHTGKFFQSSTFLLQIPKLIFHFEWRNSSHMPFHVTYYIIRFMLNNIYKRSTFVKYQIGIKFSFSATNFFNPSGTLRPLSRFISTPSTCNDTKYYNCRMKGINESITINFT